MPVVPDPAGPREVDERLLSPAEAKLYRACAARANFLSLDRPDIQFAAKEACRYMHAPTHDDMRKLKRIARYLVGHPRAVFKYEHQYLPTQTTVYSDSNWANCLKTRKSTQGGTIMFGSHCTKSWASTQATIALSSGEAEYYGLVKGASCGLGAVSMYRDMGISLSLKMYCDATAACGITARLGLGKIRLLDTHYLWLQERVRNKDLTVVKVKGTDNIADIATKHLTHAVMSNLMRLLHYRVVSGRAAACPELNSICCTIKRVIK